MHRPLRCFVPAALLSLVALAPASAAAEMAPLSSLAALPAPAALKVPESPAPISGVSIKTKTSYGPADWHEVNAATGRGYCLTSTEFGGMRWMGSTGASSRGSVEELDLARLVEKDGKVTLERTRLRFEPSSATLTATGRSHVELREVARTAAGVVVWAYRDGRDVIILTRRAERGVESRRLSGDEEGMFPFVSADGCSFAGARLDARKPEAGSFVQLSGSLPAKGTGKDKVVQRFIVDASLSRVARDSEAKIAVRVRVRE